MRKINEQHFEIITTAADTFIESVPNKVSELYSKNMGSEVVGMVEGRPTSEDLQILVDKTKKFNYEKGEWGRAESHLKV